MGNILKLPVGIDDFKKLREAGFYYIDKTGLIQQLLQNWGEVNLFTRPRRFGKTLNMSMLKNFFEIGADSTLFDGLYISQNEKMCEEYMGKYPVVFLSLKGVDGLNFEDAKDNFRQLIGNEAERFSFLRNSEKLSENEKKKYQSLVSLNGGRYTMNGSELTFSLQTLSQLLYRHYGQKTVILIDEYDVPLDKAFQNGYYQEMVSLLRGFFGQALKTNEFLQFAVLTGCLRVSKESIFTGLNNFEINSIVDIEHDEQFGFTEDEVHKLLEDYQLTEYDSDIKEWYDGYRFGNADVYCPWDVINYCDAHRRNPMLPPENYWTNTSGNDVLKHFIESAGAAKGLAKTDLERLVNGEIVEKDIRENLTYNELYASMDNLWSTLFMAGYLTHKGRVDTKRFRLAVPNREIRNIITEQVLALFKQNVEKDGQRP